jgi:Hsp70 protein
LTIIGLDIGHAETAACSTQVGDHREPQPIELTNGHKSIPTAVATAADGTILIGNSAILMRDVSELALAFKSYDLNRNRAGDAIARFVAGIQRRLGDIGMTEDVEYVVGVPSAWDAPTRTAYDIALRRAGLTKLQLIAESRAALLSAGVSYEEARAEVMVIDVGSSTTDVTGLKELVLAGAGPQELGHNKLGGGLIDEALLAEMLARSGDRDAITKAFAADSNARLRVLYEVRKAKEEYFSHEDAYAANPMFKSVQVTVRPRLVLDIEIDAELMERLVMQPVTVSHRNGSFEIASAESGDGSTHQPLRRDRSWQQAYSELLAEARADKRIGAPRTVVLTGGASRMRFVQVITRKTFHDAKIVVGAEPELAIARGLALAGRIDRQTQEFERDYVESLREADVARAVGARYGDWKKAIADIYVAGLVPILIKALANWRDSPDKTLTLNQTFHEAGSTFNQWAALPSTQLDLGRTFVSWSNDVVNDLRPQLIALMERNQIPLAQIVLNPISPNSLMLDKDFRFLGGVGRHADTATTSGAGRHYRRRFGRCSARYAAFHGRPARYLGNGGRGNVGKNIVG